MKMTNKKKSTPGGALINTQDNSTTPREKSEAEMLFDKIGTGIAYALKRPKGKVDRLLRRMMADANRTGDCIINDGAGYYRPRRDDGFDEHCFHIYKSKELARARAIIDKIEKMENSFYGRY